LKRFQNNHFPIDCGRIESLAADKGQRVQVDTKLAVLEHSAITAQVEQTEAALKVAQAQLKQVEKERIRIQALAREGAASAQSLDQIETQYELIKAQIEQTEAMLRQAKIQAREAYLVARWTVLLPTASMEIGDMANPAQPFPDVRWIPLKSSVPCPEESLSRVREGETTAEIRIDAYRLTGLPARFRGWRRPLTPNRTMEIESACPFANSNLTPACSRGWKSDPG